MFFFSLMYIFFERCGKVTLISSPFFQIKAHISPADVSRMRRLASKHSRWIFTTEDQRFDLVVFFKIQRKGKQQCEHFHDNRTNELLMKLF